MGDTSTAASKSEFDGEPQEISSVNHRVRAASAADQAAISVIHQKAFGPGRFALTAYRVREGAPDDMSFDQVAEVGAQIIGAVGFTRIKIGSAGGALLLGPLAVHPDHQNQKIGRDLIAAGAKAASKMGLRLIVLVGDHAYYGRLGFVPIPPGQISMPGPVNPARLQALELSPGCLKDFKGPITATE